jgi:hypothetical protein
MKYQNAKEILNRQVRESIFLHILKMVRWHK